MTERRIPASTIVISAVIDVVLVLVFVLIGRQSHDEGITVGGALETAWPFLVGLLVAWVGTRAWQRPLGILRPGVLLWVGTVLIGMLLRVASGQGVALAVVVVATVTLAVFLLGWRALAAGFRRIRRSPEAL
jgi:peptidoglycan/LPS O-acetylase OafA/YrhL